MMKNYLKITFSNLCVILLIIVLSAVSTTAFCQPTPLAITHVTVIDATGSLPQKDMTVLILNGRISKIEQTVKKIPKKFNVINATGKFLIPGLWDAHVHTLWDSSRAVLFFPLFIANGVTSVREMGGPMPAQDQVSWRNKISSGEIQGPRLFVPGPFVDGPRPTWPGSIALHNAAEARQAVDSLKRVGVNFIKVYSGVPRDAYFALSEEAKKQQIPFEGHVPLEISAKEASDSGQKSIEHLMGIVMGCSSQGREIQEQLMKGANINTLNGLLVDTYDQTKALSLFRHFVENETWQVPTLTIRRARPFLQELQNANDPRLKYIPKSIADSWKPRNDARQPASPEAIAGRKRLYQKELEIVGMMNKAGVRFMAGTDTPNPFCFPGFSLHDELSLLVQAGFTPMEALQTATRNPAQFFGVEKELGTIESGKIADLVLLNANPMENIENTKQIEAVIIGGKLIDRLKLDAMLINEAAAVSAQNN
jgi:hypothetical protein